MEQLKNNIKVLAMQLPAALDEDNSPIVSSIIDLKSLSPQVFDSIMVVASVGTAGANVTGIAIKVEESDDDDFSDASETVADGGAEQSVSEETTTVFQIRRTKRYLRATVTLTADGAADTVPVSIVAVLNNWAKPYPIV